MLQVCKKNWYHAKGSRQPLPFLMNNNFKESELLADCTKQQMDFAAVCQQKKSHDAKSAGNNEK